MKKVNAIRKMILTILLIVLSTCIFSVTVFAYYQLQITNKNNIVKATCYGVDISLYESISQEDYNAITDTTVDKKSFVDSNTKTIYLLLKDKRENVGAFSYQITNSNKDLYLDIKPSSTTNMDFNLSILNKDLDDNENILNTIVDNTSLNISSTNLITKIYDTNTESKKNIDVVTTSKYGDYAASNVLVIEDLSSVPAAPVATAENIVADSTPLYSKVTLTAISSSVEYGDVEYAVNTTNVAPTTWQTSNVFTDLNPKAEYYFFARYAGNDKHEPSEASSGTAITTSKANQTTPDALTINAATTNSITVKAATACKGDIEYAKSTTNVAPTSGWQTSNSFTGLTQGTNYYFFVRYKETDKYNEAVSTGAMLGMGYDVTFGKFDSTYYDSGNPEEIRYFNINFKDGTTKIARVDNDLTSVAVFNSEEDITNENLTIHLLPYSFNNVNTIYNIGNVMAYKINDVIQPVKDFGSDEASHTFTLTNNITIIGYKTGNCIDENSLITMWDGSLKKMKDIEIGDEVLSIDFETMTLVPRKVIYTSKDEDDYDEWVVDAYYLHTFSDGTTIKRAMNHRFYCLEDESYEYMHNWENGEHTYKIDGTNPSLVSTKIVYEKLHYARITLEGSNNFFANGLSTGDRKCCPNKVTLDRKLEKIKVQ